jgi:hypothetical protein
VLELATKLERKKRRDIELYFSLVVGLAKSIKYTSKITGNKGKTPFFHSFDSTSHTLIP